MISQAVTGLSPANSPRPNQGALANTSDSSNSDNTAGSSFGDVLSKLGHEEQSPGNTRHSNESAEADQTVNETGIVSDDQVEAFEYEDLIDASEDRDFAVQFAQNAEEEKLHSASKDTEGMLKDTRKVANLGGVQNLFNPTSGPRLLTGTNTARSERVTTANQAHGANSNTLGHLQHTINSGEANDGSPEALGRNASQASILTPAQNQSNNAVLQASNPIPSQESSEPGIPAHVNSSLDHDTLKGIGRTASIGGGELAPQLQKPQDIEASQLINTKTAKLVPSINENAGHTAKTETIANAVHSALSFDEQVRMNPATPTGYASNKHYGTRLEEPQNPKTPETVKPLAVTQVAASEAGKQLGSQNFELLPADSGDLGSRDGLSGFSAPSGTHSVGTAPITPTALNSATALTQTNGRAIAEAAVSLTDKGGRIDVTLSPEELGRVTVKMDQSSSALVIILSAERPETLDLIRRNIDLLEQQATALGHEGASFSFEQSSEQHNSSGDPDASQLSDPTQGDQSPKTLHLTQSTQGLDIRM